MQRKKQIKTYKFKKRRKIKSKIKENEALSNYMAYGTRRFNAAFTRNL